MFLIFYTMKELPFSAIMQVWAQSHRLRYPQLPEQLALAAAEQDTYDYLRNDFFKKPCAVVCAWRENGKYVSVLRLEPYRDGMLLTALETAEMDRGNGYAEKLLRNVQLWQAQQGDVILYSHIRKDNAASLAVHTKCGFEKISDTAVYLDGTASSQAATYRYIG